MGVLQHESATAKRQDNRGSSTGHVDWLLVPSVPELQVRAPGNARIAIWTRTGPNSTDWAFNRHLGRGTSGSGSGQFDAPYGVAVSASGLVAAIADPNNNRVPNWSEVI